MKTIFTTFLFLAFTNIIIGQVVMSASYTNTETDNAKVELTKAKQARIAKRQNKSVSKQLQSFMAEKIKYSNTMADNCMEGEVIIQIDFSDAGIILQTKVIESPNSVMTATVQKILEDLKAVDLDEAVYYGHKKIRIPIDFTIR